MPRRFSRASEASKRGGNIVFCVGSVLRGDDAAGPLLAKKLEDFPVEGWTAVDGGQTPENDLGYLRRLAPEAASAGGCGGHGP